MNGFSLGRLRVYNDVHAGNRGPHRSLDLFGERVSIAQRQAPVDGDVDICEQLRSRVAYSHVVATNDTRDGLGRSDDRRDGAGRRGIEQGRYGPKSKAEADHHHEYRNC